MSGAQKKLRIRIKSITCGIEVLTEKGHPKWHKSKEYAWYLTFPEVNNELHIYNDNIFCTPVVFYLNIYIAIERRRNHKFEIVIYNVNLH